MQLKADEQQRFRFVFEEGVELRSATAAVLLSFLEVTEGETSARLVLSALSLRALRDAARTALTALAIQSVKDADMARRETLTDRQAPDAR